MSTINQKHTIHIALITILAIVSVPGSAFLVSKFTDLEFFEVTSVTSAIGTILLSGILAYLYLQMWATQEERTGIHQNQEEIQERQTDIQERQQKMLETEKESLLDISKRDLKANSCYIYISNFGGCAVIESKIRTCLWDEDDRFISRRCFTELLRIEEDGVKGGKIIGPNERQVKIGCSPQFEIEMNEEEKVGDFSNISTFLVNNGVNQVTARIYFVTADEHGNMKEEELLEDRISIHQNMELAEVDPLGNN